MPNPVWGLSDPTPPMKLDCNDCNADQSSTRLPTFLKSLPLIVVILALAWGYESFVISMTISFTLRKRRDVGLGIAQLVVFHVLWGGTVWSLLVTVLRGPGRVRRSSTEEGGGTRRDGGLEDGEGIEFGGSGSGTDSVGVPLLARDSLEESRSTSESQSGRLSSGMTAGDRVEGVYLGVQAKSDGKPRYCRKCDVPKPDRSHHCSTCGYCVLEMDHHCPWVGGCVGHRNRKSFILFLVYLTLLAVACCPFAAVNLMRFVKTPMPDVSEFELAPISWSFLMLLGGMLSLIVGSFTAWHLYLVGTNRTTIESMERKARSRVRLPGERLEDPVLPSQERSTQSHSDRQAGERPSSTYPPMSSKPPYIQGFQEYSGPSAAARSGWRDRDGVGAAGNLARWKRDDDLSREEMRRLDKIGKRANIYDVGMKENFAQVFGRKWYLWLLPIGNGTGDGYTFPVNRKNLVVLQEVTRDVRLGQSV